MTHCSADFGAQIVHEPGGRTGQARIHQVMGFTVKFYGQTQATIDIINDANLQLRISLIIDMRCRG